MGRMNPSGGLQIVPNRRGSETYVEIGGELDMAATLVLEPALEKMLDEPGVERLVLDVSGIDFVDSAGVGCLLSTSQMAHDRGAEIAIVNPSPAVRRILDMTGLTADVLGVGGQRRAR